MIKDDISELIMSYKNDFQIKTGIQLVAYPDIHLPAMPLRKLMDNMERMFNMEYIPNSRRPKMVQFKKIFCKVADNMDYPQGEIAEELEIDRTTALFHINTKLSEYDKSVYAGFVEKLLNQ